MKGKDEGKSRSGYQTCVFPPLSARFVFFCLLVNRSGAANQLWPRLRQCHMGMADAFLLHSYRHSDMLHVHADQCIADIDAGVSLDELDNYSIFEVIIGVSCHCAARGPGWNDRHFFQLLLFSTFPLDNDCPVQMLAALKRQLDARFLLQSAKLAEDHFRHLICTRCADPLADDFTRAAANDQHLAFFQLHLLIKFSKDGVQFCFPLLYRQYQRLL